MKKSIGKVYDRKFYQQRKKNVPSAEIIVPYILDMLKLEGEISVIDLGCGTGNWLSVFKKFGCKVTGVDGGGENIGEDLLMISKDEFILHDFREKFVSDKKFTISMSLEVAEHLPENKAEQFIETLTSLSDIVIFSAAIPFQRGAGHINEQYPSYWIKKFRQNDFEVADCIRPYIWQNSDVRGFYAQNIFMFYNKKNANSVLSELSMNNREEMFDLVHPAVWETLNNYIFMKVIDRLLKNTIVFKFCRKLIG